MIWTTDDGDLRVVTIDRLARRNALRPTDLDAFETAVAGADVPVILLRGSDPTFCVGAGLDSATDLGDPKAFAKHGQRVADAVESAESVVVASIDGAARGGGIGLTLACDARAATPHATLGELDVRFGLFGAWGETVRLPHVVGEGRTSGLSLSGRVINADGALQIGLVSRIVDDPGEVAALMADNDHRSLRIVRERLRDRGNRDGRLEREIVGFAGLHRADVDDIAASHEE